MIPSPRPINNSPGVKASTFDQALTRTISNAIPARAPTNPATINDFCLRRLAKRSAPMDVISTPTVAAVKMTPVSIAL